MTGYDSKRQMAADKVLDLDGHVVGKVRKPKREWVGLTKEEVRQCGFAVPFDGAQDWALRFYKAIEAKLKEKNT